jgi:predicted O-methyltransferase YrrM
VNLLEQSVSEGVQGFLHCSEAAKLRELATGCDVLEVGAYMGLSAWCMAHTAKSVQSVDTFRAWTNGQTQDDKLTTLDAYLKAVEKFTNVLPPVIASSEDAPPMVAGDFDMIFIDAMHTYDDVLADIQRWLPRLRPGGVFAMHDYRHHDFPGVEQAADEVFGPATDDTVEITLRWVQKQ